MRTPKPRHPSGRRDSARDRKANLRPPVQRSSAPPDIRGLVRSALERRAALLRDPETTAVRLFHGRGDGCDGLVVERFNDVLIAQLHQGRLALAESAARELCVQLAEATGATAVYRKVFPAARSGPNPELEALHADPQPWIGTPAPAELTIREQGRRFLVRPYDGFSTGIFLEQRDNRARVQSAARGRTVLNLFCYTCGFSVAAAQGAASATVSVDISKRFLEWGRANFAANGIALDGQIFICDDARKYLQRAARQERTFDVIVIDPPTFARVKGGAVFELQRDLPDLLLGSMRLLKPRGRLLLSLNQRELPATRVEQMIEATADEAARRRPRCTRLALPPDFPDDVDYAKSWWIEFD